MALVNCCGNIRAPCAPVAQLDRAPGYEPGGRELESLRAHHNFPCPRTLRRFLQFDVVIRTPGRKKAEFDNPASAPGWTLPRAARRRSGAKRRTSGAAASNLSGRTIAFLA